MNASLSAVGGREWYFTAQYFRVLALAYAKRITRDWPSLHWLALRLAFRFWIMCQLWRTAYASTERHPPLALPEVLTIALFGVVFAQTRSSQVTALFARRTEGGNVGYDLARPVAIPLAILASYGGVVVTQIAAVMLYLAGCVLLSGPPLAELAPHAAWPFAASALLAVLLGGAFTLCLSLLSLRLHTAFYVDWLSSSAFQLFSGAIVPLEFFPTALRKIGGYLPFRFMAYEPMTIYLGKKTPAGIQGVLLTQCLWLAAFAAGAFLLWRWILGGLQRNGE